MTTPEPPEQTSTAFVPQQAWPAPSAPAETPPAAPRRKLGPVLSAGLAGALAGALVVGAIWLGTALDGGPARADAAADADTSCDLFAVLPDAWQQETVTTTNTARLQAAVALAVAAAGEDSQYRALAAAAQQAMGAALKGELDGISAQVRSARAQCDDL